jgi:hypothetical protein
VISVPGTARHPTYTSAREINVEAGEADTNTYGSGMWFPEDGSVAFSLGGEERARFADDGIQWRGTRVLGARRAGWAAQSGAASRTAWAGYVRDTADNHYERAKVQNLFDAVERLSQRYMALHADLVAHGLIGA